MFWQACVSHSVHGGVWCHFLSGPMFFQGPWCHILSGPMFLPRGGYGTGGGIPYPSWYWHLVAAIKADGTHPTGMHSCYYWGHCQLWNYCLRNQTVLKLVVVGGFGVFVATEMNQGNNSRLNRDLTYPRSGSRLRARNFRVSENSLKDFCLWYPTRIDCFLWMLFAGHSFTPRFRVLHWTSTQDFRISFSRLANKVKDISRKSEMTIQADQSPPPCEPAILSQSTLQFHIWCYTCLTTKLK